MRYLKNFQATFDIGTFVWQMHSRHVCLVRQARTSAHWVKIGALGAQPTLWCPSASVHSSALDVVWQCLHLCGIVKMCVALYISCVYTFVAWCSCTLGRLTKRARGAIWWQISSLTWASEPQLRHTSWAHGHTSTQAHGHTSTINLQPHEGQQPEYGPLGTPEDTSGIDEKLWDMHRISRVDLCSLDWNSCCSLLTKMCLKASKSPENDNSIG